MPAAQYRKKPITIDAMRLTASNAREVATWCGGLSEAGAKASDPTDVAVWVNIPTLEGVMRANAGDFVIRGVQGEFYPCKPDIFRATYDLAED